VSDAPTPAELNARNWATISHLSGLASFVGVPFGNVLAPLIIYLLKKDEDPVIALAARESLNFQILVSILGIVIFAAYIGAFISSVAQAPSRFPIVILFIIPLFFVLAVYDVFCVVIATVQTYKGVDFRYPFSIRFVR
jgi:uncharacterized Tic20 family protein